MVADITNLIFAGTGLAPRKNAGGSDVQVKQAAEARAPEKAAESAEKPEKTTQPADVEEVDLDELVANLNETVQSIRRELQFSVDDDTGRVVVKVLNAETQEVVRQIPREEVLQLVRNIQERTGALMDAQA